MEQNKIERKVKIWSVGKIIIGFIVGVYIIILIVGRLALEDDKKTVEQVAKIHNTKITMNDVLGTNLPPEPSNPDETVQGVDANNNGIRDDVELDIFEAYPNSQKTRAVLLQYALTQQMAVNQPIENAETANAVAGEDSRAYGCIGDGKWIIINILRENSTDKDVEKARALGYELREFIEKRQENTKDRKTAIHDFYELLIDSSDDIGGKCDIDLSTLPD